MCVKRMSNVSVLGSVQRSKASATLRSVFVYEKVCKDDVIVCKIWRHSGKYKKKPGLYHLSKVWSREFRETKMTKVRLRHGTKCFELLCFMKPKLMS